jgi:hypothetical protein
VSNMLVPWRFILSVVTLPDADRSFNLIGLCSGESLTDHLSGWIPEEVAGG